MTRPLTVRDEGLAAVGMLAPGLEAFAPGGVSVRMPEGAPGCSVDGVAGVAGIELVAPPVWTTLVLEPLPAVPPIAANGIVGAVSTERVSTLHMGKHAKKQSAWARNAPPRELMEAPS